MYRTPAPNARERAAAGRSPSPVAATPVGTPPGRRNVNLRHPRRKARSLLASVAGGARRSGPRRPHHDHTTHPRTCLLYTSDAADEEDSVDLGGRRIIKKKKKKKQ